MLGDAVHNCCRRQLRRGSLTAHTRTHACTCMNCMQNLQIVCTEELVPQRRHSSAAGRGKTLLGSSASPGRARGVGCVGLGEWHAERCGDCGGAAMPRTAERRSSILPRQRQRQSQSCGFAAVAPLSPVTAKNTRRISSGGRGHGMSRLLGFLVLANQRLALLSSSGPVSWSAWPGEGM